MTERSPSPGSTPPTNRRTTTSGPEAAVSPGQTGTPNRTPVPGTYPVGLGAEVSFCHRPKSFPSLSLQAANQPMFGTEPGSPDSPPNSFTRFTPSLMSSTSKYGRIPRLSG